MARRFVTLYRRAFDAYTDIRTYINTDIRSRLESESEVRFVDTVRSVRFQHNVTRTRQLMSDVT